MSSVIPISVGQKIVLSLQLWDEDVSQFVRAELCNSNGQILGSYNLVHKAGGFYIFSDPNLLFPDIEEIYAIYRVYSDSSYSLRNKKHLVEKTTWRNYVSAQNQTGVDLTQIQSTLNLILENLNAVDAEKIVAIIETQEDIELSIDNAEVVADISAAEDIEAMVDALSDVKVDIMEETTIEGIITDEPNSI